MIVVELLKSPKAVILFLGIFFFIKLDAQEKLRIEDPTKVLELVYPYDWKYKDDGYNLLIYPKGDRRKTSLDITYFSYDERLPADSLFWIQTELVFPTEYKDYQPLDKGTFSTDFGTVRFLEFSARESWREWRYIYFQFVQSESEFRVFLKQRNNITPNTKKAALEILKSINLSNQE